MKRSAKGLRAFRVRCELAWVAVALAGLSAVAGADNPPAFRTGVLPLLTKAGCNAGACHGAATGQGGFKLSLLGYDPEEDYERITRERGGRRIDRAAPAESLLLRKSSRQIEHEGGRRLPRSSEAFRKVLHWIEAGAPYGSRELRVLGIAVSPDDVLLPSTNRSVSLRVTARLSDGSREDVTRLALYSSNDDAIVEAGPQGEARVIGPGATSVMVRYSGQVAASRVASPFGGAEVMNPLAASEHWIDRQIGAELKRLRIPGSGPSSDAEFLRRAHLDVIGRLPTADEARAFLLKPRSREDRQRAIDALLQREEFVDFWTMRLADLLLISGRRGSEEATRVYHEWVRAQVARNTPFDELARALLTSSGRLSADGPSNFFTLASDPRDMAEHAGRIFLGAQIACARCHAHPTDRWTQEDYHRFAAYFARVSREGDFIQSGERGEVEHPKTGEPLEPRPLGARASTAPQGADRRVELARWMTSPDTTQFSRAIVNRVWRHMMGRGLVEPVDDLRPTNPATHPGLLAALAKDFVAHGHDLRWLIRSIAVTRAYQLASRTTGLNRLDDRFYSHAYLKELPAPVILDAIAQVTEVPDAFPGYPEGARAVQLIGTRTPSYALDVLGRCSRDAACDGGGRRGGGLALALHLINGPTINARLRSGVVAHLLAQGATGREMIEELYLRAFTRRPEAAELAEWERMFASASDKATAAQDLLWTALNSREFAYNH
ncbi:MAG: DUF1553 domain-containing protein [Verrucomicrobia bacterium]|nr:DUF1553 domain-containing protein [Verrucomicrobiota bacterium]MBI3869375.1 DUF1553 domain-containing protein [Verrucomicrobiota bacterium]